MLSVPGTQFATGVDAKASFAAICPSAVAHARVKELVGDGRFAEITHCGCAADIRFSHKFFQVVTANRLLLLLL